MSTPSSREPKRKLKPGRVDGQWIRQYQVFPGGTARGAGTASRAAAVGAGSAGLAPAGGVILAVTTWATTTATMTSGITASPSEDSSSVASSTDDSGSRSTATVVAPMPM